MEALFCFRQQFFCLMAAKIQGQPQKPRQLSGHIGPEFPQGPQQRRSRQQIQQHPDVDAALQDMGLILRGVGVGDDVEADDLPAQLLLLPQGSRPPQNGHGQGQQQRQLPVSEM